MAHIEVLRSGVASERISLEQLDSRILEPWQESGRHVGRPTLRSEAATKVTGAARYSGDVRLPGQLYAAVLRSPLPHAAIGRIETSGAERMPGVHAVLSSRNAPDIAWRRCRLFDSHLRFVGDEVAAVAAISPQAARDALAKIEVDYRPLPWAIDAESAEADDAPAIFDDGNRAQAPDRYQRGEVDRGFAEADVVVDLVFSTQAALHNAMEPHGCTALWEGDTLTLWESTQGIYQIRDDVARHLGLPASRVRVISEHMGGGFGAKLVMWKHSLIAALLAREAGRPVQLMLDRRAENLAAGNRNPTRQHVRLGARRDGTLTAIEAISVAAIGANAVGGESSNVVGIYQRLYRCPNVRTEQRALHTNTGPSCAFRAPGYVEGAFGLESAMDALARELEMDPLELRLANYAGEDQTRGIPYSAPEGLRACYERAWEAFRSSDAPHLRLERQGRRRGIGMAAHEWGGGGHPPAHAWAKLNGDATLDLVIGTQDIGTGTRTALGQIAAEELGIEPDRVAVHLGDTATGPFAPQSGGSATLATTGPAVRAAVADLGARLVDAAARLYDQDPNELRREAGRVVHAAGRAGPWPLEAIAEACAPHMLTGEGLRSDNPKDLSVRTFGVQIAEVTVDPATGAVTVERIVAAHDCGRIVNPRLVESQIAGGITQGIGFALLEERLMDAARGAPVNANLEDYHVPTLADVPEIQQAPPGDPDHLANATAAKGIGEPPMIPVAPAIANAIYDAVGVRVTQTPITRARLLAALAAAGGA